MSQLSVGTFLGGLADEAVERRQRTIALGICCIATVVMVCLMPFASRIGPAIPGFVLINQTALFTAYALSAWVLFRQFQRSRALPVCLLAGGALYTTAIILLQLLSFPGVIGPGRVVGAGPETTTWLWTFWHLGPPIFALTYGLTVHDSVPRMVPEKSVGNAAWFTAVLAIGLAVVSAVIATAGLPWLPHQVTGDDYSALTTSGVGPAVQLLTLLAVFAVWRNTRRDRTVLEVWILVSLVLLICDNFLTMGGSARATVGWYAGRIEALVSAFALLAAYLIEVDALRARAELAAGDVLRAEAALRQAQKMEAVGRLTGGIAHDFNNLLMIVGSGFDMIKRRPDDRERVLKTAEAGIQAVERGSKLTRQLLTFARRQNLKPETANANALLLDFESLGRRAVGEAITLEFDLDPALYPAQIDTNEFEASVLNLIVNARDAVAAKYGRIKVRTRNATRTAGARRVDDDGLAAGQYVVVSVEDNGVGMDAATQAQAFEPFFTTKEFGRGSGLGLSQVYGFARATGGTVRIVSTPGQGTTVEIWLPRAQSAMSPAPVRSLIATSALRRAESGETVLAVEDEPEVLAAVVESLTDLGYTVLAARDAAEALERLRSDDKIDILFSDIVMPGGMNGVQLAVETARIRPGVKVLLTSGYTAEALSDHQVPPDVAILSKPYRQHELAERLKVVVSR